MSELKNITYLVAVGFLFLTHSLSAQSQNLEKIDSTLYKSTYNFNFKSFKQSLPIGQLALDNDPDLIKLIFSNYLFHFINGKAGVLRYKVSDKSVANSITINMDFLEAIISYETQLIHSIEKPVDSIRRIKSPYFSEVKKESLSTGERFYKSRDDRFYVITDKSIPSEINPGVLSTLLDDGVKTFIDVKAGIELELKEWSLTENGHSYFAYIKLLKEHRDGTEYQMDVPMWMKME
jgi:hypothetical protein